MNVGLTREFRTFAEAFRATASATAQEWPLGIIIVPTSATEADGKTPDEQGRKRIAGGFAAADKNPNAKIFFVGDFADGKGKPLHEKYLEWAISQRPDLKHRMESGGKGNNTIADIESVRADIRAARTSDVVGISSDFNHALAIARLFQAWRYQPVWINPGIPDDVRGGVSEQVRLIAADIDPQHRGPLGWAIALAGHGYAAAYRKKTPG